jgi:hypothetical protein
MAAALFGMNIGFAFFFCHLGSTGHKEAKISFIDIIF